MKNAFTINIYKMKKKEFKPLKQRAKEIAERITIEKVDQYNWKIKKELTLEQKVEAMYKMFNFITIPDNILNDIERETFEESLELFEKINVSSKA